MLTKIKPELPLGMKKKLRNNKWDHANEVIDYFNDLGINIISFEKSEGTPHLRINAVDYWPATTRFYERNLRLWGIGFDNLKECVIGHRIK